MKPDFDLLFPSADWLVTQFLDQPVWVVLEVIWLCSEIREVWKGSSLTPNHNYLIFKKVLIFGKAYI
jgi:hypothetical protein